MKMKIITCKSTTVFPLGCFLFLLLSINLDCKSLNYSRLFTIIDSSGSSLLSLNYNLHNIPAENEEQLQLESWMLPSVFLQSSEVTDTHENSLTDEENYGFENWMSDPGTFIRSDHHEPPGGEVQSEEKIRFEKWMINPYGWNEIQTCH
jgi:hypothetical protein